MAKRNRYRELETNMTRVLIADAAVFALFFLFSALGWTALKVITAIVSILVSLLCLGYLYMTNELRRRRSLWMVTTFICIVICVVVSLLLNYPCPTLAAFPHVAG